MTKTFTAVLLLAGTLAAAQTGASPAGASPAPAASSRKAAREDKRTLRRENEAQRRQLSELNAQEKSAMEAVSANTSLSKSAANAEKRKIHADFKAKMDAIRSQMRKEHRAQRRAVKKP